MDDYEKYIRQRHPHAFVTPQERAFETLRDTVSKHSAQIAALQNTISAINEIAQAMQALARALTPPTGDPMAKAAKKPAPKLAPKKAPIKKAAAKKKKAA